MSTERKENPDKTRLDCLSDPRFVFDYKLGADGRCQTFKPICGDFIDLRTAIDYARVTKGIIPACVRCSKPVLEIYTSDEPGTFEKRWTCPHCKTSFIH